ncbi:MAG TPA: hypothetical protein VGG37_02715 [Opitutaceae bacterium]|jgi:hypothetical protein
MTTPFRSFRPALAALAALVLAFGAAMAATSVKAAGTASLQALDDKAPALPVTATFEKGTDPDLGPYILNLKNTSGSPLKVTVNVQVNASFHANKKNRKVDHSIGAGEDFAVNDLGAGDKVTVTAEGYAPLELAAP